MVHMARQDRIAVEADITIITAADMGIMAVTGR